MDNSNQSAFPHVHHGGLTKREYFAGLAMQGLSCYYGNTCVESGTRTCDEIARLSVKYADALLNELDKKQ